jgi:uncharacterized SAM-dependent methyltransferase
MTLDDYLLIGVELVNDRLINRVIRQYELKEIYNFVFGTLSYYGAHLSDGSLKVRFNHRLSRVEIVFTPNKDINLKIGYEDVKLNKGSQILLWGVVKFTAPLLTALLADSGFRVELYTTPPENNFALVLCQPARFHTF